MSTMTNKSKKNYWNWVLGYHNTTNNFFLPIN